LKRELINSHLFYFGDKINNEKPIELIEHKEKPTLSSSEHVLLEIGRTFYNYKKEISIFIIGFIIGVLL